MHGTIRMHQYINKITFLHQVGISLYFMRKMHGQTTFKLNLPVCSDQNLVRIEGSQQRYTNILTTDGRCIYIRLKYLKIERESVFHYSEII